MSCVIPAPMFEVNSLWFFLFRGIGGRSFMDARTLITEANLGGTFSKLVSVEPLGKSLINLLTAVSAV